MIKVMKLWISVLICFSFIGCKHQYLTGYFTKSSFQEQCSWRKIIHENYHPDPVYLDSIQSIRDSVQVKLFLGTWCSDSKKWVPRFLSLLPALPVNDLQIIAVDTTKMDRQQLARLYEVDSVPTFLFFRGDKLLGRINVKPSKRKFEKQIFEFLKK